MNPRLGIVFVLAIATIVVGMVAAVVSQWKGPEKIKLLTAPSNTRFNTQIGKIEL